jgi:2-polyprenyl-6-methoxyphenol hydroxylase-like FAD-dependent oxidoreductase
MVTEPLIVGAGTTGLSAALFLADRGIRSRIIDKALGPSTTSRAQVINPRALELLEPTGVTEAILNEARQIHQVAFYENWTPLAELEFGDAHPRFGLSVLPQARTEALLNEALRGRGIRPERGAALSSVSQSEAGIDAVITDGSRQSEMVHPALMLAADGAHSKMRAALGIEFEGSAFPEPWPLYDVQLDDPLDIDKAHVCFVKGGLVFLLAIRPGLWRVFGDVVEPLEHLPQGCKPGAITWQSSFRIGHRIASREAVGRIALAGDAAHVHSPVAARGMNLGIEDAFVFANCAKDALDGEPHRIEDYGRLRHAVHQKVVGRIEKLTYLARGRPDIVGLARHYLMPGITAFPPTQRAMIELVTGLDHDVEVA